MNEQSSRSLPRTLTGFGVALWIILAPGALSAAPDNGDLTLKEAVDIALKHNPDLRLAANRSRSSEITLRKRQGAFLPNLSIGSSGSHESGKSVDPTSGNYTGSSFTRFSLNASSSLTLFDGFYNSAALGQARENRDAADADFSRARQSITYSVAQQYMQSVMARDFVNVEQENLESQKKLLAQIDAFFKAGRRPVADLYQQQAEIAASEYRFQESERARQVAIITLLQTLGMNTESEVNLAEPPVSAMVERLTEIHKNVNKTGNPTERSDIQAQARRVSAAKQAIRAARSGFFPHLSASAGIGSSYSSAIPGSDIGNQLFDRNLSASVSLNLSVPIFDRGQTRQDVAASRVQLDNEELDLERQRRQANAEIQEARLNWENASRQRVSARTRLKYAKAALESLEDRYRANAATLAEVSQSRAQYREARYNHVSAGYSLLLRGMEILYSRGDGDTLASVVKETESKGEPQ